MKVPNVQILQVDGTPLPWRCTTVPMVSHEPDDLVNELTVRYARPLAGLLRQSAATTHLLIEADWDGCAGRWASLDFAQDGLVVQVCAVSFLDPKRSKTSAISLRRASEYFARTGWRLVDDGDWADPWGYWELKLPFESIDLAAEYTMKGGLAVFGAEDPTRWFVTITVDGEWVDLREWNRSLGCSDPPVTVAPYGSEIWRVVCDTGEHETHAPPCLPENSELSPG